MAFCTDRGSVVYTLLLLWGYPVESAVVWDDDGHFLYCSIRGLIFARKQVGEAHNMQYFHIGILSYVAAEYALWTTGCFWRSDSIGNPYFWMDILLTVSLFGLFPATRKAVES